MAGKYSKPKKERPQTDSRIYRLSYLVGARTIRSVKSYWRVFCRKTRPILQAISRLLAYIAPPFKHFAKEVVTFGKGFGIAAGKIKDTIRNDPRKTVRLLFSLPSQAYRRQKPFLRGVLNITAPVLALVLLMGTLHYWNNMIYALSVEYNGKKIGYIEDEAVLDAAIEMANGRIINVDNSFQVNRTPKLTLTMASSAVIMDENETCDALLRSAGNAVVEASGLYLDGEFKAAVASYSTVERILADIKAQYKTESDNERIEFIQDVEIIEGLYPAGTVIPGTQLEEMLTATHTEQATHKVVSGDTFAKIAKKYGMKTADLKALNKGVTRLRVGNKIKVIKTIPYLQVKVVRTIKYTEKIAYETTYVKDNAYYLGYEKVKVSGRQGTRKVVAEVELIDGKEQKRTIISSEVTAKPVNRVIIAGSKVYKEGTIMGDGISTGTFVWPVPGCTNIYSDYGKRDGEYHSGIDISNGNCNGLPIIASDGGTVIAINNTGRGTTYGMYVLIDHGNGHQTMYAHCSKVLVSVGQKVAQGEVIARVGNTGNSTGPHLHFEMRVNGKHVDPKPFVRKKK